MRKQIRLSKLTLLPAILILVIGTLGIAVYFLFKTFFPDYLPFDKLYILLGGVLLAAVGLLILILLIKTNSRTGLDIINRELLYFKNGKLKARLHPEDITKIDIKNGKLKTGKITIHTEKKTYRVGTVADIQTAVQILSAFRKWIAEDERKKPVRVKKTAERKLPADQKTLPETPAVTKKPTRRSEKKAKTEYEERSGEKLGDVFEEEVYSILSDRSVIPSYHKVLKGLFVESDNGRITEIDAVALTRNGIYVIECKDYSGTIVGTKDAHDWNVVYDNGEMHKLYNPILQNSGHITALSHKLRLARAKFRSVIILSGYSNLNGINYDREEATILSLPNLGKELRYLTECGQPILSKEEIDTLYATLEPMTNATYEMKLRHLSQVEQKKEENKNI